MSEGEKKALKDNPDSSIVFLDSWYETAIVSVLIQVPYENTLNGYSGIKYEALKDFISWMVPDGYDSVEFMKNNISMLLNLGSYYSNCLNSRT